MARAAMTINDRPPGGSGVNARSRWMLRGALVALFGAAAAYAPAARLLHGWHQARRLDQLAAHPRCAALSAAALVPAVSLRAQRLGPLLASWETIGGCGAGGSSSLSGIKWIGRNVTGGLFDTQVQSDYVSVNYGYNYVVSAQVSRALGNKWSAGAVVPYLYKYYLDYKQTGYDVSNGGLGDISVMVTRRLGPIDATTLTAAVGIPSATYGASYKMDTFSQDKQLGFGRFTGTLILDHVIDETWGLVNVGAVASYRGGRNDQGSYRPPSGTAYGYVGYLLGPLVPAFGASLTGFTAHDQDRGTDQDVPLAVGAINASIEWSSPWVAILLGGSEVLAPVGFAHQSWTLAMGLSLSPF